MLTQSVTAGTSNLRTEYFDCACFSHDHSIRFAFDPTEDDARFLEIWVDSHFPSNKGLWERIVMATKYVLKMGIQDCTYGSWILRHEDERRLKNFFNDYDRRVWELKQAKKKQEGENASDKADSV